MSGAIIEMVTETSPQPSCACPGRVGEVRREGLRPRVEEEGLAKDDGRLSRRERWPWKAMSRRGRCPTESKAMRVQRTKDCDVSIAGGRDGR